MVEEIASVRDITNREKFAIIQEVRKRSLLWDIKDKANFPYDPSELKNEWMAVRDQVSALSRPISVNVIQAAWKNLKDTHIKVRQKSERKSRDPNRTGIDTVVRWKFWDAMEFMRDVPVTPRSRNKLKNEFKPETTWLDQISSFPLSNEVSSSHQNMNFVSVKEESTSDLVLAAAQSACESIAQCMSTSDQMDDTRMQQSISLKWEAEDETNEGMINSLQNQSDNPMFPYSTITTVAKAWHEGEANRSGVSTTSHEHEKTEDGTTGALSQSVSDMYRTLKGKFPRQAAEFRKKINDLIYEYDLFLADNLNE
uniref:MADF domain-containing protein n=1 Tax=Acrobeloides nanus TaxID=290746 RepID=A0A914EIC3_9BILA